MTKILSPRQIENLCDAPPFNRMDRLIESHEALRAELAQVLYEYQDDLNYKALNVVADRRRESINARRIRCGIEVAK